MLFSYIKTANKHINEVNNYIDSLCKECPSFAWDKLRTPNIALLKKDKKKTTEFFNSEKSDIRSWTLSAISNVAGDLLETGKYNVYPGILNFEGEELFKIYKFTTGKLVEMGVVTKEAVDRNIEALRSNINHM